MTIAREIEKLIARLDGVAVCDGCITDTLNLSVPAQANVVTRALAGQLGFERQKADRGLCGAAQTVIRRRARSSGLTGSRAQGRRGPGRRLCGGPAAPDAPF